MHVKPEKKLAPGNPLPATAVQRAAVLVSGDVHMRAITRVVHHPTTGGDRKITEETTNTTLSSNPLRTSMEDR